MGKLAADGTRVILTHTKSGIRASVRYGREIPGDDSSAFRIYSVDNLRLRGSACPKELIPPHFESCILMRWPEEKECVKYIKEKM